MGQSTLKKRLAWLVLGLVVVGGSFGLWRYISTRKPPPPEFKTAALDRRRISGRVTASGTLQATVTVQVGTQVSGRVQTLFVDFNSPVKKGQPIAKIDPQLFQATVDQARANFMAAKANVTKAEAQLADADRQLTRTKALHAEGLASAIDLQAAETNLAVSRASLAVVKAAVEQSTASLNQAQVNLSYTNIASPIDGVVISRNVDVGQTVAASLQAPVLFTIAEDLRKMEVNTNVSEGDVGRLTVNQAAFFTVDAFPGQRFKGKVGQIRNAAQTVQNVVTYNAIIEVDNSDLRLRPGMTANVTVTFAEKPDVLAVPNAALRFRPPPEILPSATPGGSGSPAGSASASAGGRGRGRGEGQGNTRPVWLLRNGTVEAATVTIGLSDGSYTEVVEGGVKEGDSVISDVTLPGKPAAPAGAAGNTRRLF